MSSTVPPPGTTAAPVAPTPTPDPPEQRLDIYYRVRDDLNAQITAADTKALTLLTVEGGILVVIATLAPWILDHLLQQMPVTL